MHDSAFMQRQECRPGTDRADMMTDRWFGFGFMQQTGLDRNER